MICSLNFKLFGCGLCFNRHHQDRAYSLRHQRKMTQTKQHQDKLRKQQTLKKSKLMVSASKYNSSPEILEFMFNNMSGLCKILCYENFFGCLPLLTPIQPLSVIIVINLTSMFFCMIIIIFLFGNIGIISHLYKCNTNSKLRAMPA